MLRVLIIKEIRDLAGSSKFVYTFAASALLILLAFYSGAVSYRQNLERWEASEAESLRVHEGLTDWARVEAQRVFLKPQPLAALVNGVADDVGRVTSVARRGEIAAEDSRYGDEPIFAIFRFLDLGFIFQVVLTLFAILLGYDAVSGEKEHGTLKLCMANAVSRATLLLGKFIGAYLVLTVSLLTALGVGCLLLPLAGMHLTGEEWLRLGLIIAAGLLFFGVFLAMALFASACTHRSAGSFLLLLVAWVGSILILPRAAVLLAGRAVEVPSVDEVGYQKAAFASDLFREFRDGLASFQTPANVEIPDLMTVFNRYMDSLTSVRDGKMAEYRGRINEQRDNRENQRARVALGLARLSPAATLAMATSELAGTSPELKRRFYDQAMAHQAVLNDFLFEKTGTSATGRMIRISSDDAQREPIDPRELPAFTFRQPSLGSVVTRVLPDMGLLAAFNLLFLAAATVAFNRYDVR